MDAYNLKVMVPEKPVTEWTKATTYGDWCDSLFRHPEYNERGGFYEEPVVRIVRMRVPGKWERRVRCWVSLKPRPGYMAILGGEAVMQAEADDGCPLDRAPVVHLASIIGYGDYIEDTEFAGLEWKDI